MDHKFSTQPVYNSLNIPYRKAKIFVALWIVEEQISQIFAFTLIPSCFVTLTCSGFREKQRI